MKENDAITATEVLNCIQNGLSVDGDLLERFIVAVDNFNVEITRRKTRYSANADMLRQRTKEWRKNNHERKNEYQREYNKRDYVKDKRREYDKNRKVKKEANL